MNKAVDSFFPLYASKWLNDLNVRCMTFKQRGVYLELMCYQWLEGGLPIDEERVRLLLGLSEDEWKRVWTPLLAERFEERDGKLVNPRLAIERAKAEDLYARKVKGGKKGGAQRKRTQGDRKSPRRTPTRTPQDHNHYQKHLGSTSPTSPSSSSIPIPSNSHTSATAVEKPEPPWPDDLQEVKAECEKLEVLDQFNDPKWWRSIDEWLKDTGVGYLDELPAYIAWWRSQSGAKRHRNLKRGFRNWLSTNARWEQRDAQKEAIRNRRSH